MSLGSRAVGRLRELYNIVWWKNRLLNQQRQAYPSAMHRTAAGALLEELEPRLLLSSTLPADPLASALSNDTSVIVEEPTSAGTPMGYVVGKVFEDADGSHSLSSGDPYLSGWMKLNTN